MRAIKKEFIFTTETARSCKQILAHYCAGGGSSAVSDRIRSSRAHSDSEPALKNSPGSALRVYQHK